MSFPPVCDENSRVLILGTYPSPKSRETGFYYGHPQNRFWPLMAALLGEPTHVGVPEKTALLLRHGIALWDVCGACEVTGASDASIRAVEPNDVAGLLRATGVTRVFCNGATAGRLCLRHVGAGIGAVTLPSTSPANAAWSFDRLLSAWTEITKYTL